MIPVRPSSRTLTFHPVRILIVTNTASGRGTAEKTATSLQRALAAAGHDAHAHPISFTPDHLQAAADAAELMVIIGGDGTVHACLPAAVHAAIPVYHAPTGTENLFAREFGMDRSAERLLRAIQRWRIVHADVGDADGRLFVLMVSVGLDASVLHRLAASRNGPIRHISYFPHVLAELARPSFPTLTVQADGLTIVGEQPGLVIVANSRHYAMRLNPARRADIDDGCLDVVFMPMRSRARAIRWMIAAAAGRLLRDPDCVGTRCTTVRIEADGPALLQMDGEAVEQGTLPMRITVRPGALKVLSPTD